MEADRFHIIPITPDCVVNDEARKIELLLRAGATFVHIRKPSLGFGYVEKLIEQISPGVRHRLTLHDHPELAAHFGTGFQINSRTYNLSMLGNIRRLSMSCHSLAEIDSLPHLSYVTLSPIFDSISKENYPSRFNISEINLELCETPVIALGGVTFNKLDTLREAGFSGGAMIGEIWNSDECFQQALLKIKLLNSQLQFITDGTTQYQTYDQAVAAIKGGCQWIQVRMKDFPNEAIAEVAEEISHAIEPEGGVLIVDDHIDIASNDFIDGVHLGQNDTDVSEARAILGQNKIIGLTINSIEHLNNAVHKPVDYFGIGPYRFTTTKKRLAPVLGIEGYRKINLRMKELGLNQPYVAIGGITLSDIQELLSEGVPGIAVSGAIGKAADPVQETKKFIKEINKYHHIK